jgi:hypothetical protein
VIPEECARAQKESTRWLAQRRNTAPGDEQEASPRNTRNTK